MAPRSTTVYGKKRTPSSPLLENIMDIRSGMKKLVRGVATGGSIAALLTLSVPANAGMADLESQQLDTAYACPGPESGCGGKDDGKKDGKKDEAKKDGKKGKKGKKEGKCGEGKCGEGKCG
jgi:hypothetical protein